MPSTTNAISVDSFTKHPEVLTCIEELEKEFGKGAERLLVSDVLDNEGHQYVHLVQKGGGVLGVALVGYTYILEQMGIRFIRLAGTSAGAINTSLMTVIGATKEKVVIDGKEQTIARGDKKLPKSEKILEVLCALNFFDLVDGHPIARFVIRRFITHKDFAIRLKKWIKGIIATLIVLPAIDFICLGLQHKISFISYFTKGFFVLTGFFIMLLAILIFYLSYLSLRLKDAGFGINPGDFFYDWIKRCMTDNKVNTVSDLISVASTPVPDLYLRGQSDQHPTDLQGDVTFIASEIVTMNKVEFPRMSNLFKKDINELQPAGFVRASMSIPIFFESYFINDIPCKDEQIKQAWKTLDENDPPSVARFVDGGILSNFPINIFFNKDVAVPRLPSFGIDLDDTKDPAKAFATNDKSINSATPGTTTEDESDDEGKHAENWSLGGYAYRMFNTVRNYYDKDFLIKNQFFKKGIGVIPLKGYGWLNFFLEDKAKIEMFVLGAKAATEFLKGFDWEDYKKQGVELREGLKN